MTGFISVPILTRLFLPAEYGVYALAAGAIDFLYTLAFSGLGAGVVRFYPAYRVRSALSTFYVTLGMSVGFTITLVSVVCLLGLANLQRYLEPSLSALLTLSIFVFVAQAPYAILMNLLRAQERSKLFTIVELLTSYVSIGLGLLLVMQFGFRMDGLLWGALLAYAVVLPFLFFSTTRGVPMHIADFQRQDAVLMWQYAWPLLLGNLAMWGLRLSDRYLIGFFGSASDVGLYSVAYNLSSKSIDILVTLFLLSMGPIVMNTWETHGRNATEDLLTMITRTFVIVCLPAAAGLTILASPFAYLFTTEAYHDGFRIIGYVAFSGFAYGLSRIAGQGLLIGKETLRYAFCQIAAVLVNIGLNLVLVPRFGFVAAGITTLIGYVVMLALLVGSSQNYLTWHFPWRTLRNSSIATTLMGIGIWASYSFSGDFGGLHVEYLLFSMAFAVGVYFLVLWQLGEAHDEERDAVGRLWTGAVAHVRAVTSRS